MALTLSGYRRDPMQPLSLPSGPSPMTSTSLPPSRSTAMRGFTPGMGKWGRPTLGSGAGFSPPPAAPGGFIGGDPHLPATTPWGSAPDPLKPGGWLASDPTATPVGERNRMMGDAISQGLFRMDASNPLVRQAVQIARRKAEALKARSSNVGSLFGLDPSQYGNAMLRADLAGQGRVADAQQNAQGGVMQWLGEFYKKLLDDSIQNQYGWLARDQQGRWNQSDPKGSGWDAVSGLLGAAAGGWASGGFQMPGGGGTKNP